MPQEPKSRTRPAVTSEQWKQIAERVSSIRYGTITLVIQDGVLIQIEQSEKIRFPKREDET